MTLTANPSGVVTGKFTIPANVPAGIKNVQFVGAGGSMAQASFFGQGTEIDDVRTLVTQVTTTSWFVSADPLAQTFTLLETVQAAHNTQFLPDGGAGDALFGPGRSGGIGF